MNEVTVNEVTVNEVSKSQLKARMFEYLRQVEQTRMPLVIKDYGEPVLIVYPYSRKKPIEQVFSDLRGKVCINDEALLSSEIEEWSGVDD